MANRKLLAEVERLLKKVVEGVELFEQIYEKIQTSSTYSQKEKYEAELKKEIKKLQRYRDQIKTWSSSSDIKDKKSLIESRKTIEALMERFKQLEREIKTKAYSKEGLTRESKVDPAEKEKHDICLWVTACVDKLSVQMEGMEAETEVLNSSGKSKKDPSKVARLAVLQHKLERHKHHIVKLEIILRMVENDALTVDEVKNIRDDLEFYVEENHNQDFEEDEGIYDELDLEDPELYGIANASDDDMGSQDVIAQNPVAKKEEDIVVEKIKKTIKVEKKPAKSIVHATPVVPVQIAPKIVPKESNIKYATVVQQSAQESPVKPPPPVINNDEKRSFSKVTEGKVNVPSIVPSQSASQISLAQVPVSVNVQHQEQKQQFFIQQQHIMQQQEHQLQQPVFKKEDMPSSLSDLVKAFENAKETSLHSRLDTDYMMQMVDSSARKVPDMMDIENITYETKSVYPTPSYYPQTPIRMESLEKCDLDVLFLIFYYYGNTFLQWLAAKELKKQSWRYHLKYQTWFQRHEEPRVIMEDYEIGVYVYWDYEGWGSRKKEEFKFEYEYLEDCE